MDEERALIQRAQQGDVQAFAALYQRYQRAIYSLARHLTGDAEEAADLTQETFVKAWRALPRLRTGAAFGGWLRIIVSNLVRDRARRRKGEILWSDQGAPEEERPDPPDSQPGFAEQMAQTALQEAVRRAVLRLPEPQRIVIIMHHFEGRAVADIAAELGLPLGTVLSRLARGRQALRRRLGPLVER